MKKSLDDFENIEDFFKNELKDFESEPSEKVWNNIESKIPSANVASYFSTTKLLIVGSATILVTTFFVVKLFQIDEMKQLKQNQQVKNSLLVIPPVSDVTKIRNTEIVTIKSTSSKNTSKTEIKAQKHDSLILNTTSEEVKHDILNDVEIIETEKEIPKENKAIVDKPLDFYSKTSQAKKDSTRPIFVPKK